MKGNNWSSNQSWFLHPIKVQFVFGSVCRAGFDWIYDGDSSYYWYWNLFNNSAMALVNLVLTNLTSIPVNYALYIPLLAHHFYSVLCLKHTLLKWLQSLRSLGSNYFFMSFFMNCQIMFSGTFECADFTWISNI